MSVQAVTRAASLTQRLLAFSRQQTLEKKATDVSGLIVGLDDLLRRTLGETIELRAEIAPNLWPAMLDASQFENALVNLAVNARDAMPEGGLLVIDTANVTLDGSDTTHYEDVVPGDYVTVAVIDTGTGIAPEILEKIFEPFFTTKDVGEGSGLGLSMVYGFAKQSDGQVTIVSEVGQGTTVKLYLPRSGKPVDKRPPEVESQESAAGAASILVVEDDEALRQIPVTILREQGYKVVEAQDGKEAIRRLKDGQPFDLLFTDVVLPGGINGFEIADQAKGIQPNIKILYTTGYADNAVVQNGNLDSRVPVINKPYRRAELLEKVRAMLNSEDTC